MVVYFFTVMIYLKAFLHYLSGTSLIKVNQAQLSSISLSNPSKAMIFVRSKRSKKGRSHRILHEIV
jgi:hypothetical protein